MIQIELQIELIPKDSTGLGFSICSSLCQPAADDGFRVSGPSTQETYMYPNPKYRI